MPFLFARLRLIAGVLCSMIYTLAMLIEEYVIKYQIFQTPGQTEAMSPIVCEHSAGPRKYYGWYYS